MTASTQPPKAKNYSWKYILHKVNRRATLVGFSILLGYIGWFYNRTHIQAAATQLIKLGYFDNDGYGLIQAASYGFQLSSKFISGTVMDVLQAPRMTFLIAGLLSIVCTIGNTFLTSLPAFILFFSAIKFLSAFGKVGALKVIATWYPKEVMGTMGGVINVASNLGEFSSRVIVGQLLSGGVAWQSVFYVVAAISLVGFVPTVLFVADRPPKTYASKRPTYKRFCELAEAGEPITVTSDPKVEALEDATSLPKGSEVSAIDRADAKTSGKGNTPAAEKQTLKQFFTEIVMPLLKNKQFYVVLVLSITSTALRESLVAWVPMFFTNALGVSAGSSATLSGIYNFSAMFSCLAGGMLLDKTSKPRRGLIPLVFMSGTVLGFLALYTFTRLDVEGPHTVPVAVILLIVTCFALSAPNSFLDGVYVVEMAGSKGAAFASGVVGSFGYAGAAIAMIVFPKLATTREGWMTIWLVSMGIAVITVIGCGVYWWLDLAKIKAEHKRAAIAVLSKS